MAVSKADLMRAFDEAFPRGFQRALVKVIHGAYANSENRRRDEYPGPEGRDLRPIERRAQIERDIKTAADPFPEIVCIPGRAKRKNSHHVVLRSGNEYLTIHATDSPASTPRPADFRYDYANGQMADLFVKGSEIPPDSDSVRWWVATHGPSKGDPSSPAFIHVGMPDQCCETFQIQCDLMTRVNLPMGTEQERQPEPQPMRKRARKNA